MLKLTNIKKDYVSGDSTVHALKGVSLEFRKSEFVSILGQSGCGKTTLLNIIGGLDKYSDGDLIINDKSTKKFTDRDWDTYRNHSIGFIFQSYNLIPHQTVLSNVELALTLSGIGKKERRQRAKDALIKVGLGDQINKKPNQMSGGQMQRVAIARALVNDPEILLADEPTGALDSETSVQIMELIKEISKDKLVIMVTHNPELAEQYSTRIINLLDGLVISDSNPYEQKTEEAPAEEEEPIAAEETVEEKAEGKKKCKCKGKKKKTSMSFFTAFVLSLNNLLTKKGRTVLTSFAGSIGIIGIALIFAISNGLSGYISYVQESTLSTYPITLEEEALDLTDLISKMGLTASGSSGSTNTENRPDDSVYKDQLISELLKTLANTEVTKNKLDEFKSFLEEELKDPNSEVSKAITAVQYTYNLNFEVYTKNPEGEIIKSDTNELMMEMMADYIIELMARGGSTPIGSSSSSTSSLTGLSSMMTIQLWQEIIKDYKNGNLISDVIKEQYDLVSGYWPNEADEVVLVVDEDTELDDLTLYALGFLPKADKDAIIDEAVNASLGISSGDKDSNRKNSWTFDEILYQPEKGAEDEYKTYKVFLPADFYQKSGDTWVRNDDIHELYYGSDDAITLKITGIIRLNEEFDSGMISGSIGYTSALTEALIKRANSLEIIKEQKNNTETDIFTGLTFKPDVDEKEYFTNYIKELAEAYRNGDTEAGEQISNIYNSIMVDTAVESSIEEFFKSAYETDENGNTVFNKEKAIELLVTSMQGMGQEIPESTIATLEKLDSADFINFITPYIKSSLASQTETALTQILRFVSVDKKLEMLEMSIADMTNEDEVKVLKEKLGLNPDATNEELEAALKAYSPFAPEQLQFLPSEFKQAIESIDFSISIFEKDDYEYYFDNFLSFSQTTYESNLVLLGDVDISSPHTINIYTNSFENKDFLNSIIKEKDIKYTDYLALIMSGITKIINSITYVLVAFVGTSLVVSSIMIGVITLISVQERTKEIGVLRAMGASKRDVSRVFNAETLIVGLTAGIIGIVATLILIIFVNIIMFALSNIPELKASLGFWPALGLILISMILTLIAGLIPSRVAAKKDPVIALRTE